MEALVRFEQLEYIIKLAEVGSITQAAKELFISQPSLSNALQNLEKEMNITIFNRSQKGVTLTTEGAEFLSYANQVLEQIDLLNRRYKGEGAPRQIFSVAGQHYSFVVDAFVELLKEMNVEEYQASLKEMRTYEVMEDIANLRSEVGVIYRSNYNQRVINSTLDEFQLSFTPLQVAKPHVFVYKNHPLVKYKKIRISDLDPYPKLSYDQGQHNSFYFWEEILADYASPKNITVTDRATLFNLVIGLNGYTISSGIINHDLNGEDIVAVPLDVDEEIEIGYITSNHHKLRPIAQRYIEILEKTTQLGFETTEIAN